MESQAYVEQVYHVQVVRLTELRTQSSWEGGGVRGRMPICAAETQPAHLQEGSVPASRLPAQNAGPQAGSPCFPETICSCGHRVK